ncbi:MAG: hypothetical protein Q4C42_00125 [Clostridia bacterium]|nr:hypothetical protein [Clostridia bacterium]
MNLKNDNRGYMNRTLSIVLSLVVIVVIVAMAMIGINHIQDSKAQNHGTQFNAISASALPTQTPEPVESSTAPVEVSPSPTATPTPSPTPDPEVVKREGTIFAAEYSGLSIEEKIEVLRKKFPDGKYWNYYGHSYEELKAMSVYQTAMLTSDTACANIEGASWCNVYNGITSKLFYSYGDLIQCMGFASMVNDFLWGEDTPIYISWDINDLEVGDHLRMTEWDHSMTVIGIYDGYITVLECNRNFEDCLIEWDREVSFDWITNNYFEIIKRGVNPNGETYDKNSNFGEAFDYDERPDLFFDWATYLEEINQYYDYSNDEYTKDFPALEEDDSYYNDYDYGYDYDYDYDYGYDDGFDGGYDEGGDEEIPADIPVEDDASDVFVPDDFDVEE